MCTETCGNALSHRKAAGMKTHNRHSNFKKKQSCWNMETCSNAPVLTSTCEHSYCMLILLRVSFSSSSVDRMHQLPLAKETLRKLNPLLVFPSEPNIYIKATPCRFPTLIWQFHYRVFIRIHRLVTGGARPLLSCPLRASSDNVCLDSLAPLSLWTQARGAATGVWSVAAQHLTRGFKVI